MIREDLPPRVGAVLTDHHKRAQEDCLQRDDHCQQPEREWVIHERVSRRRNPVGEDAMWRYTNHMDPANQVIPSAIRFWRLAARSSVNRSRCGWMVSVACGVGNFGSSSSSHASSRHVHSTPLCESTVSRKFPLPRRGPVVLGAARYDTSSHLCITYRGIVRYRRTTVAAGKRYPVSVQCHCRPQRALAAFALGVRSGRPRIS